VADTNNPTTIKENQEVTLKFLNDPSTSTADWSNLACTGATIVSSGGNLGAIYGSEYTVTINNAKSNVTISLMSQSNSCCFVAGTKVHMDDGTTKNIEDVKIGDNVLSYNETTKEYEKCEVIGLITNPNTTNLARITLVDGTIIEMNEYHPIYTQEGWKSLTNYNDLPTLTKEDKVLSTNGEFIDISTIECWIEETPIITYNLSVEKNHNYFVGITPVLVHNASCPIL